MLEVLNTLLWGRGRWRWILGTGAWLTLRTGGFPQRNLGWALTLSLGREARRKGRGGVSPFGSLMTALASTVGTGNIVGVAAALVSGGPGALVWMELAALLGLATKFAECMLAVKYRRVRRDGTRWGGPMAVMEARLGAPGRWMGKLFAVFALLMAFTMGAWSSPEPWRTLAAAFAPPLCKVGLVTAVLARRILLGGVRRIADAATVLVPVMALVHRRRAGGDFRKSKPPRRRPWP
ncbi:MAG: alanine:cation symporter family protein [Dysosmobacter sp.]